MHTIHVISHTHWDREWYRTFQQFRLKLIHLVDGLLDILEQDPAYKHFMLDGQTIVLDDYLLMRPENEQKLREHIQTGRILIGPWHILPDMFLVGPEAHIRNLLEGERTTRKFGPKMMVGYMPDSFGHIGQMPQILRGFGIDVACLWRGLDEEPTEFWWQAPDGSQVLLAYLRDSYSNGLSLPIGNLPAFAEALSAKSKSLAAHSATSETLIMFGHDHLEPPRSTSQNIAYADQTLKDTRVIHSTLPQYVAAVQNGLRTSHAVLPTVEGELRACKRMPLLPGVLSTRMWIKQRNAASENLLTKWVEPFTTFAELTSDREPQTIDIQPSSNVQHPASILHQTWRLLMENHPHDSICGCSIDQVHEEMKIRFDQVDQIGEELTRQALETIAEMIVTNGQPAAFKAIVVFNPASFPRSDSVLAEFSLPPETSAFEIVDELGNVLPHETSSAGAKELFNMVFDPEGLRDAFQAIHDGMIANLGVRNFTTRREGQLVHVDIIMAKGTPDKCVWERGSREFSALLEDPSIAGYHVRASLGNVVQAVFSAPTNPSLGWRTFYVHAKASSAPQALNPFKRAFLPLVSRFVTGTSIGRALLTRLERDTSSQPPYCIENEFFTVVAGPDGMLSITDKHNGVLYEKLNHFVDGGDSGDEYNYSPPDSDTSYTPRLISVSVQRGPFLQTLTLNLSMKIPPRLNRNRKSRGSQKKFFVSMPIVCHVSLAAGVPRVDVHTSLENKAQDHRLRVHFPLPFEADSVNYDGHFEIVHRKIGVPEFDRATWVEDPRPEAPQRAFTDVSDGQIGLILANRGLPEVEVLKTDGGSEIALTLLRCVGWLSRDDFQTRRGHAGPEEATPDAQMIGKWSFDYSIIPHGKDHPYELAYAFETPLRTITTAIHAGSLPEKGSFMSVSTAGSSGKSIDAFIVSAVKQSESGQGWIVRGYNTSWETIEVTFTPWKHFKTAAQVNLAEQKIVDLMVEKDTGSVKLTVKSNEIVTVSFDG